MRCLIGIGPRLIQRVHEIIADQWAYVVDRQRFLLTDPAIHVPALEQAIAATKDKLPGSLPHLLDTASRT